MISSKEYNNAYTTNFSNILKLYYFIASLCSFMGLFLSIRAYLDVLAFKKSAIIKARLPQIVDIISTKTSNINKEFNKRDFGLRKSEIKQKISRCKGILDGNIKLLKPMIKREYKELINVTNPKSGILNSSRKLKDLNYDECMTCYKILNIIIGRLEEECKNIIWA